MSASAPRSRTHNHDFYSDFESAEASSRRVFWLSMTVMVAEIVGGMAFSSMALLADGWHMATDVAAVGVTVFAYRLMRRFREDQRFSFGTAKIAVLAAALSALMLVMVAGVMIVESLGRLQQPLHIQYLPAIGLTLLGLGVNALSAWWLHRAGAGHAHHHFPGQGHDHGHRHDHKHDHGQDRHDHHDHDHRHGHDQGDLNLRAAYLHTLADAATSVLALLALVLGYFKGWRVLDPVMGVIGGLMILSWSVKLLRDSANQLVDRLPSTALSDFVHRKLEQVAGARITDIHFIRVSPSQYALVMSVETSGEETPDDYKAMLAGREEICHVTVEINRVTA